MIVACYHPLPLSACMLNFDLVSILPGTSIPTSFNILVKMFLHFTIFTSYIFLPYISSLVKQESDYKSHMILYSSTVVMSVECLTALMKDIDNIMPLGVQLGIKEDTLHAIQRYYGPDEKTLMISHVINMWLLGTPENSIRQLTDTLNELKKYEIAQQLVLLTSLGKKLFTSL